MWEGGFISSANVILLATTSPYNQSTGNKINFVWLSRHVIPSQRTRFPKTTTLIFYICSYDFALFCLSYFYHQTVNGTGLFASCFFVRYNFATFTNRSTLFQSLSQPDLEPQDNQFFLVISFPGESYFFWFSLTFFPLSQHTRWYHKRHTHTQIAHLQKKLKQQNML